MADSITVNKTTAVSIWFAFTVWWLVFGMFSYINEQDRQNSEQIQVIKEAQINSKKDIEIVKNDVGYIRWDIEEIKDVLKDSVGK